MTRYSQGAEQQVSPSNLTKYCSCHAKRPACWILVTYETYLQLGGATSATLQPHQILRLPRKKTPMLNPRRIWSVIYNARGNRCVSPSNLTKYCACRKTWHCKISAKMSENRWNVIYKMRGRSEHDPTMIRAWNRQSATRLGTEVAFRDVRACRAPDYIIQKFTKCCPCQEKSHLNFPKYCTGHEKWRLNFIKCCTSHENWHLNFTKCCPCHEKSHLNFTKCCPCQEKWHLNFTKCCPRHEKWHVTSPKAAPATKSHTWTSPSAARATNSDTWTSPNAAPATRSDTWTSPKAAPGTETITWRIYCFTNLAIPSRIFLLNESITWRIYYLTIRMSFVYRKFLI